MLQYNPASSELLSISQQENYEQCLKVGNYLLVISLVIMTLCILVSFTFDQHFSLSSQVIAHVSTIIFAATAKIGYVIRCVGAQGLGHSSY